jgi:2-dehydropantoate 2-reductase
MKITVFGPGAVGGNIAARLARSGARISVVARGAHLRVIREKGITLQTAEETVRCHLTATDNPGELGIQDLIIVTVKRPALANALSQAQPLIGAGSRLLIAMNGLPWWFGDTLGERWSSTIRQMLDADGTLSRLAPVDKLIWGMVIAGGEMLAPGVVFNSTPTRNALEIGYADGKEDEVLKQAANALKNAGFLTSVTTDIRTKIWFKLLMNAGQAMVATATERNAIQTVSDPETRAIVVAAMREIMQVGRALGIEIEADPVAMTDPSKSGPHRSSFLQDLKAGRPLEIGPTILAVRDLGRAAGVATPHLSTVAAIVAARSHDACEANRTARATS